VEAPPLPTVAFVTCAGLYGRLGRSTMVCRCSQEHASIVCVCVVSMSPILPQIVAFVVNLSCSGLNTLGTSRKLLWEGRDPHIPLTDGVDVGVFAHGPCTRAFISDSSDTKLITYNPPGLPRKHMQAHQLSKRGRACMCPYRVSIQQLFVYIHKVNHPGSA